MHVIGGKEEVAVPGANPHVHTGRTCKPHTERPLRLGIQLATFPQHILVAQLRGNVVILKADSTSSVKASNVGFVPGCRELRGVERDSSASSLCRERDTCDFVCPRNGREGESQEAPDSLFQQTDGQLVPQHAILGDVRPSAQRNHRRVCHTRPPDPQAKLAGSQQTTGLVDGEMPAPVDDTRHVELQQALSQRHEGQQARVEEEQKQQAPLHSETVRH